MQRALSAYRVEGSGESMCEVVTIVIGYDPYQQFGQASPTVRNAGIVVDIVTVAAMLCGNGAHQAVRCHNNRKLHKMHTKTQSGFNSLSLVL
jgi:hypothetical protein